VALRSAIHWKTGRHQHRAITKSGIALNKPAGLCAPPQAAQFNVASPPAPRLPLRPWMSLRITAPVRRSGTVLSPKDDRCSGTGAASARRASGLPGTWLGGAGVSDWPATAWTPSNWLLRSEHA
jgi:hypothetical protein